MTRRHFIRNAVALAIVIACFAPGAIAGDDGYKIIVNPNNPITSVDRDFVRDAYLKKTTEWGNGAALRPIDLAPRFPQRDRFTQEVVHKTPSQLKSYWNQQIFSGKGVPPPEADSVDDVIGYVLEHPGAVGYVPASADPGRAKVVRIN
jgi:ABC-type phosphate transport system substrate-binding protein